MSQKLTSIVISAGLLLGIYIAGENATAATTSSVTLSRITATFQQSEFATHYTAQGSDNAKRALTFKWTLKLQLVDKADATNSGTPGSKASVDSKCNNSGRLTSSAKEFIWKHGDAGLGGCDHSKMGPSGHQGRVTLIVSDGIWSCGAIYGGTNSGEGTVATCKLLAAPAKIVATTVHCQGPSIKLFDNSNGGGVQGAKPGTLGLRGDLGVIIVSWTATGSAGQANAVNVNWTANVTTPTKRVVIKGNYKCVDSEPATWSQDAERQGMASVRCMS